MSKDSALSAKSGQSPIGFGSVQTVRNVSTGKTVGRCVLIVLQDNTHYRACCEDSERVRKQGVTEQAVTISLFPAMTFILRQEQTSI